MSNQKALRLGFAHRMRKSWKTGYWYLQKWPSPWGQYFRYGNAGQKFGAIDAYVPDMFRRRPAILTAPFLLPDRPAPT